MEKRLVPVAVFFVAILLFFIFFGFDFGMTGFATFGQGNQSEFDLGTHTLPFLINFSSNFSGEGYSFLNLDNDLIFWMRMDSVDSSGNPVDLSNYSNNGTLMGDSVINSSFGKFANGSFFDGFGDYINIPDSDSLDSPGVVNRLTVCSWFNARDHGTESYKGIVGKYDSSGRAYLLGKNTADDKYGLFLSETGDALDANVLTNSALNTNQWYHLCGVFDGSSAIVYLDGVEQTASATLSGINSDSSAPLQIGEFWGDTRYFNGSIDEVLIFKRDLSSEEIGLLYDSSGGEYSHEFSDLALGNHSIKGYFVNGSVDETDLINFNIVNESSESNASNASFSLEFDSSTSSGSIGGDSIYVDLNSTGLTHYSFLDFDSDLIFWMRMDDVDGVSDVLDGSSYENHGSLIGTGKINSSSGVFGNGLWMDGDSDKITIPDSVSLDSPGVTDKITICSWFNVDNHKSGFIGLVGKWKVDERQYLLGKASTTNKYGILLSADGQSHTTNGLEVYTNNALNLNQWYHLCATFNGSNAYVYLDGNKQSGTATASGINADGSGILEVGSFYNSDTYNFDGMLDEVLIFNRDLDETEIKAIYNSSANQYVHNFTDLSDGSYNFRGYAVNKSGYKLNTNLGSASVSNGSSPPSSSLVLTLNSATSFENVFEIPHTITTNIDVNSCWFSRDGASNVTMHETNDTAFWYDDVLDAGMYNVVFYCSNGSDVASLSDSYVLRKSKSIEDVYYTNSQGLDIHFDFYFNSTSENGRIVMIPDSWSSTKDSYRDSVGAHFLNLGFASVTLNTRGKGASEGDRDAFGYECLDIYEAINYLRTDSTYSGYVNDSIVYIWGFSAAGGKAGVCSAKYPDLFASAFATGGVLNITKWYSTNPSYQTSIEDRVGATPSGDSEAFLTRDGAYLGENSQTPIRVTQYTGDSSVNYALARNYNESMTDYGKTIEYIEVSGGGHAVLGLDDSDEFFETYSSEVFIPSFGNLKIGGYVGTKNFSIALDDVSGLGLVDYDISDSSRLFNLTTYNFEGNASLEVFDLIASIDYTISVDGSEYIGASDSLGDLSFNVSLTSSDFVEIIVSPAGDYCGDSVCNGGETCSSCSGDCGICSVPSSGGGGGGGGGGGFFSNVSTFGWLTLSSVDNLILDAGDKKSLSINVENKKITFVDNCKILGAGEYSDWISSDEKIGLAGGQANDFDFELSVPEFFSSGVYEVGISVVCDDINISDNFNVEILVKELIFSLIEVDRVSNEEVKVLYILDELSGLNQEVELQFLLLDSSGGEISEKKEIVNIAASSKEEFETFLFIDENFGGDMSLLVNLNSETYSTFVQENIVVAAPISGFLVAGGGKSADNIFSIILAVVFLIFGGFIIRRIFWHKKNIGKKLVKKGNKK